MSVDNSLLYVRNYWYVQNMNALVVHPIATSHRSTSKVATSNIATSYSTDSTGATLTSKGQVTIPIAVREALGIQQGDRILFVADARGHYTVQAQRSSHTKVAGMLRVHVQKAFSDDSFRATMAKQLQKKFAL